MKIDILTIFPEFFDGVFDVGIIRRAKLAGIVEIDVHDIREFARDKHRKVDDRPFGGGEGMVLKPEPLFRAIENLLGTSDRSEYEEGTHVVMLTPRGKPLVQTNAAAIADKAKRVLLICGRYEGVDERVMSAVTDEISIGDYVLSGGEPAAVVLADAVTRLLPGALGNEGSAENDSFSRGILDYPNYTQPREYRGMEVPEVLLSGNHEEIEKWRHEKALEKTRGVREDLLKEKGE
ncbi:MAG: tRNA (guanosine(37)-N1)-methyltransferase TrmD [Pyrinomonadaceae bacterium]|nr:tRNA (guanosine(37)-N1)-methyltransferase TrmD [Pyrinomonadaceae bacterium]